MDYLLIDGNNLAIRSAFANKDLTTDSGIPTGSHYGMFLSLVLLINDFENYQFLIVWDGKSKRRIREANNAVEKGLIKSGYKANRKRDEQSQTLIDFYEQAPYLRKGINQTGIPQIRLEEFEADDVIASYSHLLRDENKVLIVTTDKDYYQLLHPNVVLWDGMKKILTIEKDWRSEFNLQPTQHIDCGALSGDVGDNIHGIPGWGEKTALKAIQKHGSYQKVYEDLHKQHDSLRNKFPDLDDESQFSILKEIKTKSGKPKYPEISIEFPFTGVALAIEEKRTKAIPKTDLLALMFEERVPIAYSLKKMDTEIENLPEIKNTEPNKEKLLEYFNYFEIESMLGNVDLLTKCRN